MQTTVANDGTLKLNNLPFPAGESVGGGAVIVLDTHIWIWWVHGDAQLPTCYTNFDFRLREKIAAALCQITERRREAVFRLATDIDRSLKSCNHQKAVELQRPVNELLGSHDPAARLTN